MEKRRVRYCTGVVEGAKYVILTDVEYDVNATV
jgi:hypothetical protein